ncbi:hypothetical protein [Negadavirga shengliensis]|uniref:6-bladed beta-propeller protein n=1 Tax=Negadavirga shengliensis TaxID=1389218 RepID=A0ABV9SXB9_9BACT
MFSNYRIYTCLLFLNCLAFGFACNPPHDEPEITYELIKTATFPLHYAGEVHACDFRDGRGVIYNFKNTELVLFDSSGNILRRDTVASEGSNSLSYISGLKILSDGNILVNTLSGEIAILNKDLQLEQKISMPFPNGLANMRSNVKVMDIWKDELLIHYPGRGGKNPYMKGYFKENKLVEKVNLNTGEASPFLDLPPDSQYQEDLYFDLPHVFLSVYDQTLYFAFDKEPMIHLYNLKANGRYEKTIDIAAEKFVQLEGQPFPAGHSGSNAVPGTIDGLYPFDEGIAVNYREGIDEETRGVYKNVLKIYHHSSGWSNELVLPRDEVSYLLNFESPEKPFYALQYDSFGHLHVVKFSLERKPK